MSEGKQVKSGARKWAGRAGVGVVALTASAAVVGCVTTSGFDSLGAAPTGERLERMKKNPHYDGEKFNNVIPTPQGLKKGQGWTVTKEYVFGKQKREPTDPLPVYEKTREDLATPSETGLRITWIGHSTILIEVDGATILTDPVWGKRASPTTIAGPKRFHEPPIALEELPKIDAVLISHDHYDHLDMPTIKRLAGTDIPFFAPLGTGAHLEKWGIEPERITEVEWWDEHTLEDVGVKLISAPCRHFSGRRGVDMNHTLWTSWVLVGEKHRVYFSGDTGMTPQFNEIGEKLGPFDLAMIETGAYHESWGNIHLGPEGAVEAAGMVKAKRYMPIHWGTFNLALHGWTEPVEQAIEFARKKDLPVVVPRLGKPIEPTTVEGPDTWWRGLE